MTIDELIKQADEIKNIPYDSPRVSLWKKRTNEYISKNYGDEYVAILRKSLSWGNVIRPGEGVIMHRKAFLRAIEFLESVKNEPTLNITMSYPSVSFELDQLHPLIYKKCESLFVEKQYGEAVEKSFKIVRDRLRQLTGYERGSEAFGKGKLHILGATASHVDKDFNEGVKYLTMAIDMFRNEKSHTADGNIDNPTRAYEYLMLSSLAMNLLENTEIRENA